MGCCLVIDELLIGVTGVTGPCIFYSEVRVPRDRLEETS